MIPLRKGDHFFVRVVAVKTVFARLAHFALFVIKADTFFIIDRARKHHISVKPRAISLYKFPCLIVV